MWTCGQRRGRSIFNLSLTCENVSQMILQQIVQVDKTVDNMTVNLGDEIVYNLYPELSDIVVVITWYSYHLDSQAARLFKDSKENNGVVVLIITAPYPHPFLFMTDFRQHLLNHISTTTTTCKIDVVAAPDLFTLITDRVRDVSNAVQF